MKYLIRHHVMTDYFTQPFKALEDALAYHRSIQQKSRWEYHIEESGDDGCITREIHWQPVLGFNVNGKPLGEQV